MEFWGMSYLDLDDLTFIDNDPELPGEEIEERDELGNTEVDDDPDGTLILPGGDDE